MLIMPRQRKYLIVISSKRFLSYSNNSNAWDGNKVSAKSVKRNSKYYAYDADNNTFYFLKKLDTKASGCGYADGSTQTLTKASTYVLNVKSVNDVDNTTVNLTPVFIIVK